MAKRKEVKITNLKGELDGYKVTEDGKVLDKDGNELTKFKVDHRNEVKIEGKSYKVDELVWTAFNGEIAEGSFIYHEKMYNDSLKYLKVKSYDDYRKEKEVEKVKGFILSLRDIQRDCNAALYKLENALKSYKFIISEVERLEESNPLIKLAVRLNKEFEESQERLAAPED